LTSRGLLTMLVFLILAVRTIVLARRNRTPSGIAA
jgi:hypothetical protein